MGLIFRKGKEEGRGEGKSRRYRVFCENFSS